MRWVQRGGTIPETRQDVAVHTAGEIQRTIEKYEVKVVAITTERMDPMIDTRYLVVYEEEYVG